MRIKSKALVRFLAYIKQIKFYSFNTTQLRKTGNNISYEDTAQSRTNPQNKFEDQKENILHKPTKMAYLTLSLQGGKNKAEKIKKPSSIPKKTKPKKKTKTMIFYHQSELKVQKHKKVINRSEKAEQFINQQKEAIAIGDTLSPCKSADKLPIGM